ncbi:membrane protein [Agaricicola taiwanensis]|uniref:Membrane protein n=1 Tax=Agaricicola taiwanensis TaxID=591372 RepID=A0A8J2VLW4_9RHOB|nr:DMT family transporter [Agaricicola taiwanensis]GGE37412.1 membrane protein [Agaricicola taiwanensis]
MSLPFSGTSLPVLSANQRGILAMLGAMALFTVNDALVKLTAASLPASQIMTIRGGFAIAFMMALILASGAWRSLRALASPIVALRGCAEMIIGVSYVSAIAYMALGEIVSVVQATPLILTALSVPFLGEKVGWRRWAAVLTGFAGVLLILRPGISGFNMAALLALGTAVFMAIRDLMTLRISPLIPALVVGLGSTLGSFSGGLLLTPFMPWGMPSSGDVARLAIAAVALVFGNWCMVIACRGVDLPTVSPFRYSVVLWALLLGFLIWGDVPDTFALLGTGLIVGSGIYTIHRENRLRARAATTAPVVQSPPGTR